MSEYKFFLRVANIARSLPDLCAVMGVDQGVPFSLLGSRRAQPAEVMRLTLD